MKNYSVALEVSGPTAMWTRPDTGDVPVSYPAPTSGAVKGMFECILWSQWAEVVPIKVEICRPIVYHSYTTNYGGPLRKSKIMKTGGSFQLVASVLINVCYRLYADVRSEPNGYANHGRPGKQNVGTTNGAHAYEEVFKRRLNHGQFFSTPFMGWKEFTPDYVGHFREKTLVCTDINLVVPSMLRTCFPAGKRCKYNPIYDQDVKIERGTLRYAK